MNYGGPDRSIKPDAFKIGPVKPRSYRNRRLGDFLKELDLTEGKATGIPRIKKALKENDSPEPFFDFDDERTSLKGDFYIHSAFKEERINVVPVNDESLNLGERAIQILDIIKSNQSITAAEIAEKIEISKRAIEKNLAKLKSVGIIDRIGSDKTGHWITKSSG